MRRIAVLLLVTLACVAGAEPAAAGTLTAGAGRADITPPTGYYMMGWVRSDGVLRGQHTRLFARALVLERDGRKVALVAADLGAVPAGVVAHATDRLKDRGFSERNVIVSASHTHAAATGFYNFSTYNTVFMTMNSPTDFNVAGTLDPQLYAFMVRQVAEAIRRADDDRAPAAAAWGTARLVGPTRNRSLEAHLNNHGIVEAYRDGRPEQDPLGAEHTIDPIVNALRVDKVRTETRRRRTVRGIRRRRVERRIPLGMFSTYANHGTVNPYTFDVYNADHHGAATRVAEAAIRREGRVPRGQEVVNAYGNSNEGDQSAGLDRRGPVWAEEVGRREAAAMLDAWRDAGRRLSREPPIDLRWTRVCFCGQQTEGGAVDDEAVTGLPLFTGSEEGRGPLYDQTQTPFEDRRSPAAADAQGQKIQISRQGQGSVPRGVPLLALRLGDRVVATIPGEMTVAMGQRVREAVSKAAGGTPAVISGLANEYLQYFTTPEEYDRQHYEGGSQLYGRTAANLLKVTLADLTTRMVSGQPAPEPYAEDPRNGVSPDAAPFGQGAENGRALEQPVRRVRRLDRATFSWQGGPRGLDRPLGRAFVQAQLLAGRRWRTVTDDLGLQIVWRVDDEGRYRAEWEIPPDATRGAYRLLVSANRYELASEVFRVERSQAAKLVAEGGRLRLTYPEGAFTARPAAAPWLRVTFRVGGRRVVRRSASGSVPIPSGASVLAGAARDRYYNVNAEPLTP